MTRLLSTRLLRRVIFGVVRVLRVLVTVPERDVRFDRNVVFRR